MVRKMIVQIILWLNACRKRGSEKTTEKFFIPTNTGVPIPSHLKKAKISVQIDGTKITNTFIANAGPIKGRTANIFFARLFINNRKEGDVSPSLFISLFFTFVPELVVPLRLQDLF